MQPVHQVDGRREKNHIEIFVMLFFSFLPFNHELLMFIPTILLGIKLYEAVLKKRKST